MTGCEKFNSRLNQNKELESLNTVNLKLLCEENKKKKRKRVKKVLWDIIKGTNICIMGVSERADKDKESESLFKKIMIENSQIWGGK